MWFIRIIYDKNDIIHNQDYKNNKRFIKNIFKKYLQISIL